MPGFSSFLDGLLFKQKHETTTTEMQISCPATAWTLKLPKRKGPSPPTFCWGARTILCFLFFVQFEGSGGGLDIPLSSEECDVDSKTCSRRLFGPGCGVPCFGLHLHAFLALSGNQKMAQRSGQNAKCSFSKDHFPQHFFLLFPDPTVIFGP